MVRVMLASLISMFSFAGRSNRAGFLATALVIGALQLAGGALLLSVAETLRGVAEVVLGGAITWMLFAAVVKRLHDIDRSAWSLLAGLGLTFAGTLLAAFVGVALYPLERLVVPSAELAVVLMIASAVPLTLLTWLHAVPGDDGANAYGAPPASHARVSLSPGLEGA